MKGSVQLNPTMRCRVEGAPVCQVVGCGSVLTAAKDYHIRYRICYAHFQVDQILIEGMPQRFCQQCGRFHLLELFDGPKRTCRDKLSRHNARRRKNNVERRCQMLDVKKGSGVHKLTSTAACVNSTEARAVEFYNSSSDCSEAGMHFPELGRPKMQFSRPQPEYICPIGLSGSRQQYLSMSPIESETQIPLNPFQSNRLEQQLVPDSWLEKMASSFLAGKNDNSTQYQYTDLSTNSMVGILALEVIKIIMA